jgi:hypothetical protein
MNKSVGLHNFMKFNGITFFALELIYIISTMKKLIKCIFAVHLLLRCKTFRIVIRW